MFQLLKTEGKARRGVFTCAHGTVQTPVFMNVGTQGAIKGALSAADLKDIGCQVELSNTYHLHLRPGDRAGARSGRPAPVHDVGRADPDGFRRISGILAWQACARSRRRACISPRTSTAARSSWVRRRACRSSRTSARISAMAFDECIENPAPYDYVSPLLSTARYRWLVRCKAENARLNALPDTVNPQPDALGHQSGRAPLTTCASAHMQQIAELDLPGYAIGGLAVGESRQRRCTTSSTPSSPICRRTNRAI